MSHPTTATPADAANPDPFLTADQAADYLNMSVTFLRRAIAREELPAVFFGRYLRIRRSALEAYAAHRTTTPDGGQ